MPRHSKKYINWSENLKNSQPIHYPKNDIEIIALLNLALYEKKKLRVVGSSHSCSPVVTYNDEGLFLVSLSQYKFEPQDILIDHDEMTVQVNAGWKLSQLYDKLNEGLYFLETQTAGSPFVIGGVLGTPTHGGRLGGSLMADSVVALTLINEKGEKISKTSKDEDFKYYRLNFGVLGIITSVTFRIHQMLDVESKVTTFKNIFIENQGGKQLNRKVLKEFFWDHISYCLAASENFYNNEDSSETVSSEDGGEQDLILKKRARYTHCFIDYHNNKMLALDWKERRKVRKIRFDGKESSKIRKIPNILHRKIFSNYRQHESYLKMSGKLVRTAIYESVNLNKMDDQDMLWASLATRVYFMAYFVPVYTEGDRFRWKKVAKPLNIVIQTIEKFKAEKRRFNLDFPSDLRFVTSSDRSLASPIYSSGPRTVYLAMEILCGPENIYLDSSKYNQTDSCWRSRQFVRELNGDFREFYSTIEQEWKKLGGVPHWGKAFGFRPNKDPFNPKDIKNLLNPEIKAEYRQLSNSIFENKFVKKMWKK